MLDLFVSCAPGIEPLLAAELAELGIGQDRAIESGGVALRGDMRDLMRANLWSGLALHVLLRVAEFPARHMAELERKCTKVDWQRWMIRGSRVRVKAHSRRSRLYHTGGISQRVRGSLAGKVDDGSDESLPLITIQARIEEDICTLSIDTSGPSLHKRGWKQAVGKAPLREDLARALLLVSGWTPELPLVDPMAGAGTIVIEAARWARNMPPGGDRDFAFFHLACHDTQLFANLAREAEEGVRASAGVPIVAGDRDAGVVAAARENALRAGVSEHIRFECAAMSRVTIPPFENAGLVSNPPYGRRVSKTRNLRDLYAALGNRWRQLPGQWKVGLLCDDPRLVAATGFALDSALMTDLGGLKVRAFVGGTGVEQGQTDEGRASETP